MRQLVLVSAESAPKMRAQMRSLVMNHVRASVGVGASAESGGGDGETPGKVQPPAAQRTTEAVAPAGTDAMPDEMLREIGITPEEAALSMELEAIMSRGPPTGAAARLPHGAEPLPSTRSRLQWQQGQLNALLCLARNANPEEIDSIQSDLVSGYHGKYTALHHFAHGQGWRKAPADRAALDEIEIVHEVVGHKHAEFVETNDYKRLVQDLTKLVL